MESPLTWENPAGYKPVEPNHDEYGNPCKDLGYYMSWIFWRASIIEQHGGTDIDIKAVRHLMLNGLLKKDLPSVRYKIEWASVYVLVISDEESLSICMDIIDERDYSKDCHFTYHLAISAWDSRYIEEAIKVNKIVSRNSFCKGSAAFDDCRKYIAEGIVKNDVKIIRGIFRDEGAAAFLNDEEFVKILEQASQACLQIRGAS